MAQRIEAIEDNDGKLHLASRDGKCWRLASDWADIFGHATIAGGLLEDMVCTAENRFFTPVDHHARYQELMASGADIIAILDADDNVFRYVDRVGMGEAGRHWLGEDAAPSGTVVAINWVPPSERARV